MTVYDLRRLLADMPDEAVIVLPGEDYSFDVVANIKLFKAGFVAADGGLPDYLGQWDPTMEDGGWHTPPDKMIDVAVIGLDNFREPPEPG